MKVLIFFVCLLGLTKCQSSSDVALSTASGLYTTLRNAVFPKHELDSNKPIANRFLLLMPGKVLNYFDYFPGRDYVNFIQNLDASNQEAVIPPHVMEKWFDLADAIISPNPMNGQTTGKSLVNVYRSILYEIKVLGLDSKTPSERGAANAAVRVLNELVVDPENVTHKVPRLSLYERYRDLYNDRRLEMENEIEEKRTSVGFLDYQLWFQRNYPSLQSKVEGAYTRWLIFGDKEKVELNIAVLDTGSAAQMLEEARMSLRASAVQSLDRTRKIYPVSFEPSDWYKYLLPEIQKPSQDQLRLMYGRIISKSHAIEAMIDAVRQSDLTSEVEGSKQKYEKLQESAKTNIAKYIKKQYKCLNDSTGAKNECLAYDQLRESLIEILHDESLAFSSYQNMNYYKNNQSKTQYINYLQREKSALDAQGLRIQALLGDTGPYLGGFLDSSTLTVANVTDARKDDQWTQFEFNRDLYQKSTSQKSKSESVTSQWSFNWFFVGGSGEYSHHRSTSSYRDQILKSNMQVKGEFLRVTIKRPWFKPEVFENPEFTYRQKGVDNDATAYVSPGQGLTETQFYESLTDGQSSTDAKIRYKLPEYTTAFLLARNIELEFSGMSSESVSYYTSEMSQSASRFNIFCFHAGYSASRSEQTSHTRVEKTASGMKIKIPGAQIIGYFTQIIPRFPISQS